MTESDYLWRGSLGWDEEEELDFHFIPFCVGRNFFCVYIIIILKRKTCKKGSLFINKITTHLDSVSKIGYL